VWILKTAAWIGDINSFTGRSTTRTTDCSCIIEPLVDSGICQCVQSRLTRQGDRKDEKIT
jgi:hypothetical protein